MDEPHPRQRRNSVGQYGSVLWRHDYSGKQRGISLYEPQAWIDMDWIVHRAQSDNNRTWCEGKGNLHVHVAETAPLEAPINCLACLGLAWRYE